MVCHDPKTRGLKIAQSSAQQLDLPLLREVLARYRSSAFLDIELKVSGLEKSRPICCGNVLRREASWSRLFSPRCCGPFMSWTTIPLGLICETQVQLSCWRQLPVEYVIPHRTLVREISSLRWAQERKYLSGR